MAEAGTILGDKYRLLSRIGEGGMATVWLAVNIALERTVAVKFITRFAPNQRERFLLEAKVAASIHHRNVIDILDFGVSDEGEAYMVLEYMEGESLADRMARPPALTLGEIVNISVLTLSGLSAAHNAGVVHRDLKPENIFLVQDEDGWYPKLLDFGVSKTTANDAKDARGAPLTQEGMLVGTPQYMAPEQARGLRDVDVRADLWSMGIVLYELLTGELPFDSENVGDVLLLVMTKEIMPLAEVRPEIGPELSAVVMKALERDREDRWQTARDMRAAILDAAAKLGDAAGMWGRITPGSGQGQLSDPNLTPISGLIQIAAVEAARASVAAAQRSARATHDTQDPAHPSVVAPQLAAGAAQQRPPERTHPARPSPGPPPSAGRPPPGGRPAPARRASADELAATIPSTSLKAPRPATPIPVVPSHVTPVPAVPVRATPLPSTDITQDVPLEEIVEPPPPPADRDLLSTAPPLPGEGLPEPEAKSHAGAWLFAFIAVLGLGATGAYVLHPEWFASLLGGAPQPVDAGVEELDAGTEIDANELDAAPEVDAASAAVGIDGSANEDGATSLAASLDGAAGDAGLGAFDAGLDLGLDSGELDAGDEELDAGDELEDAGRHGRPTKIRRPPPRRRHPPPRWRRGR